MTARRGTTNRNERGSAASRRALKVWMLATFGDGISAPCAFCGRELLYSQITKDRFPIPGRRRGKYVRGNVRPACLSCNAAEGARQAAIERTEAKAKRDARNARRRARYAERKAVRPADELSRPGVGNDPIAA
jgi:hypothetical protein